MGKSVLKRIFRFAAKSKKSGPQHCRAYAIGDVHGRVDLLRELIAHIEQDNAQRPQMKTFVILLGDLVDRGPDSRGVIDYLLEHPLPWAQTVFLKGNHEEFFQRVLDGEEEIVADWLDYGGYECAESYGVSKGWALNATPAAIVERLQAAVPASHRKFLSEMADTFRFGDYLFVHAGIRPGIPINEQSGRDLRWIRDGFLENRSDHGLVVVHGHTIVERPEEHPNRIAVDTGAYRSGVLTALGLEGSERWFLEARSGEAQPDSPPMTLGILRSPV